MLLPLFTWFENSGLGQTIRTSRWLFPAIEATHLVALAVIGGAILIVDMRLLGLGLRRQPVAEIARDAQPWLVGSLLGLLITGVPMIMGNGEKYYYSDFFWRKMGVVVLAVIFTFTLRRKVTLADETRLGPFWAKAAGLVSIALWTFVTVGGRMIGLS